MIKSKCKVITAQNSIANAQVKMNFINGFSKHNKITAKFDKLKRRADGKLDIVIIKLNLNTISQDNIKTSAKRYSSDQTTVQEKLRALKTNSIKISLSYYVIEI